MDPLRIGGRTVGREQALAYAHSYLTEPGWAYPVYDDYCAATAQAPLDDADLLAPVLLNAHLTITAYEGLRLAIPQLQATLDRIPYELDLAEAEDHHLQLLAELFAVLDGKGIPGVQGTILAKLLHRKRPRFIPLQDAQVRRVYVGDSPAPVPKPHGHRTWMAFTPLFAAAVQADLRREASFWEEVAALASGPAITRLRALDIAAWWAGSDGAINVTPAVEDR